MKKVLLIILKLVLLPITIILSVFKFFMWIFTKKKIHKYLSNVTISDIDAISGFDFEEVLVYIFKYFGYKTKLTKKSGDYGVDLFAMERKIKYCIQAKLYYNHSVGSNAIQQINTAKNYFNSDFAVVVTNAKYSKQALDMANKLKVILIDRTDLIKILNAYKSGKKKFLKKLLEEKKNV